jgi:hypothetical protein
MDSLWNPLTFIPTFEEVKMIDIAEVKNLGRLIKSTMKKYSVDYSPVRHKVKGREVGDDRTDISKDPVALCTALTVQEVIVGMITSDEDTRISKTSWDFCEQLSTVPTDPHNSYDFARKTGDFTNLGYNDSIILRLILDVHKGQIGDHSSTPTGKVSMLGSRLRTPRREHRGVWQLASLFQDAALLTHKSPEPKYLPASMGGSGVTALFDNSKNVYLYVKAYKGGTYARIYGTAVHELDSCLSYMERGMPAVPILSNRLREKQEYFWGTYAEKVFVPAKGPLKTHSNDPDILPLYYATGGANMYQNYENRMIRAKDVLTRSQAEREWEHTQRLQMFISSYYSDMKEFDLDGVNKSKMMRERFNGALTANSALQNLLKREATLKDVESLIGDSAFRMITSGQRDFTLVDAEWVYRDGAHERFTLKDIAESEDIFLRTEVSEEETFKVGGIILRPITNLGLQEVKTVTRVGLWQINKQMSEWSKDLSESLRDKRDELGRPLEPDEYGPIMDSDPEWVNDDTGLIARCQREHRVAHGKNLYVFLISGDRRLANQMAESANVTVCRLNPDDAIRLCAFKGISDIYSLDLGTLREQFLAGRHSDTVYFDTGSVNAALAHYERGEHNEFVKRKLIETGRNPDSHKRFSRFTLAAVKGRVTVRPETHTPLVRPKWTRSGSRSMSATYSEHSSWRGSDSSHPHSQSIV